MLVSMWVMAHDIWALRRGKNGATRSAGTDCAMNLKVVNKKRYLRLHQAATLKYYEY